MAILMKGHRWRDHKHKMAYPAWAELKQDEIRVRVHVHPDSRVEFLSYAEKPLANMDVFANDFLELNALTGIFNFDCGFEANGNFNDSYRWVRSTKSLPTDLKDVKIKWFLYDLPESEAPFYDRAYARQIVLSNAIELGMPMETPQGWWVHSEDEVDKLFERVRKAGYEGLMVKHNQHLYELGKRTYGWLKVKSEEEADGIIVGFTEAISIDGTPLGRAGSVQVRMEDGSEANASGIPFDLGLDIFDNPDKYVNQQWAVIHYMERDRQGGYRHPNLFRLREAKA